LLVDIYRTSETQTFYNSNYIKVKFDYQTFISNITKQWEQQMQRASTDANLSKYQSKVHDKLIIETEKQKDALKNNNYHWKPNSMNNKKPYYFNIKIRQTQSP
jgi:hypothetical protein